MSASLPVTVEYIDGSTVIDITNLLEGLTWSGDLATAGRSVTINIRNTAEGDKPIIDTPKLGRRVQCYKRGKRFFVGYIFDVQKDSNGSVTLEAHDSNVYLAKNKDSMKFSKKKASQIVKEICSKYGIAVGQIDDTGYVIPTLIFRQKTLFEMIHTALTETRKKTNKIYIVGNENGKLTLKERKTQTTALVISDGTNIFSATHSENMEDLRNSVKVTGKSGEDAKGAIADDAKSIKEHGLMRETQHEGELLDNETIAVAKALLTELNQTKKEMAVSCIGDTSAISGNSVYVYERMIGLEGHYYVSADTHTFTPNGLHTMELTLSRSLDVIEIDYEDPTEDEEKESTKAVEVGTSDIPNLASYWLHAKINRQYDISEEAIEFVLNRMIAGRSSVMKGMASAFLNAASQSGLNVIYLIAHAAHETGWGTSNIAKKKYNFYGIAAFDASPYASAYEYGAPEAGIVEGAGWIARNYPNGKYKQDTLYKMRHNNGVHQYATDPAWDTKIAAIMASIANLINEYNHVQRNKEENKKTDSRASDVVKEARSHIGLISYRYGGNNIEAGYGDCSAFTQYVLKEAAGISIGRSTSTQVTKGTLIDAKNAQAGDLVFFKGTYRSGVSHVGIVTSKGKFVHLADSGCKEDSYEEGSYWSKYFMQVRRVIG